MPEIRAFRGLRYDERRAGPLSALIAPPYDVISPTERAALVARSPYNIVAVELPEDAGGRDRYAVAADLLAAWEREGVLTPDPEPRLYLYEQEFPAGAGRARRRGLIAAVALTDWSSGAVLPHERTLSGPKEDRRRLLRATRTNISPVFGIYEDAAGALRAALDRIGAGTPDATAALEDGQTHRLWIVADADAIDLAGRTLAEGSVVIADGHHRYETALEYLRERQAAGQATSGDGHVLMVLVELADPGLIVVPTHRVCRGVPETALADRLASLHGAFAIEDLPGGDADGWIDRLTAAGRGRQALLVVTPRGAHLIARQVPAAPDDALDLVDTAVLEAAVIRPVLEPVFGDAFPEHVTYVRDPREAIAAVRGGGASFAGLVNPTPPAIVKRVAEAGQRMPQKTTYFYPKLSTGVVLRRLDLAEGTA